MAMSKPVSDISEGRAFGELLQRIITASLLLMVSLAELWLGGWMFLLFVMVGAYIMSNEWDTITPKNSLPWQVAGIAYITLPCIAALALRDLSLSAILYPILLIIATDSGAYFAGRAIGGPKIAPRISPKKTWAGLGGGIVAAMIASALLHTTVPYPSNLMEALILAPLIAILAQVGDFFQSWLKRRQGVKDSGSILPGHGGLLDRLDGYILVLPLYLLYLTLCAEIAS